MKKQLTGCAAVVCMLLVTALAGCAAAPEQQDPSGRQTPQTVTYENRVAIWEHPAGYSTEKKADHMNIRVEDVDMAIRTFAPALVSREYADTEALVDTFYYGMILEPGLEKETYEDVPDVVAFPVSEARGAVIILPGGGFAYKSVNWGTGEGPEIAQTLNEAGYAAFILNYRTNPYEFPVPLLDLQRAVRYLRANADTFGFPADNIGAIGFSAGGYAVGGFLNLVMGKDLFPAEYEPDETDRTDDTLQAAMMIYPMLDFRYNVPMLFCVYDADTVRNAEAREMLLDETDLSLHFTSAAVPQFIAYGLQDIIVGTKSVERYLDTADRVQAPVTPLAIAAEGHGFEQGLYMGQMLDWLGKLFQ